jgi:hypothetical protein
MPLQPECPLPERVSLKFAAQFYPLSWDLILFLLLFLEIYLKWGRSVSGGGKCQISGTEKYPAGHSSVVQNMSIPVVRRILIQRVPVGRPLIHKTKFYLASKGIAKVARFLSFILLLKLISIQIFLQQKTFRRPLILFLKFQRLRTISCDITSGRTLG